MPEDTLAREAAARISPQKKGLWNAVAETWRLLGHDMPEAGWETQSDLTPLSEWADETMGPFSFLNPIPKTRGDEFYGLANLASSGLGGAGLAKVGKTLKGYKNLDELTEGLERGARNLDELEEGLLSQVTRPGQLDEISRMTRGKTYIPPKPKGRVGRYGYGGGRRKPSPLERDVEVPLGQLGGEGKEALAETLRQLL